MFTTHHLRTAVTAAVAALTALVAALPANPAHADGADETTSVIGTFEGTTFHLADGWGEAHACVSDDGATARCYRTEAEMDAAEGSGAARRFDIQPLADCSGSGLRLYANTNYGGDVLQLKQRGGGSQPRQLRLQQRDEQLQGRGVQFDALRHDLRRHRLPRRHQRVEVGIIDVQRLGQPRRQRLPQLTEQSKRSRGRVPVSNSDETNSSCGNSFYDCHQRVPT